MREHRQSQLLLVCEVVASSKSYDLRGAEAQSKTVMMDYSFERMSAIKL